MLLGGRSLRTVERLISRLPKRIFLHYGTPVHVANAPRVLQQHMPKSGVESPAADMTLSPLTGAELLDGGPTPLVEHLNDQFGDTAVTHEQLAKADVDVISAYLAVRQFPSLLPGLRAVAYTRISKRAGAEGLQQVMRALAEDVLSHFPRDDDPAGFSQSILAVLSHATSECPLPHQLLLRLFEGLVISNKGAPPALALDVVQRIATAACSRPNVTLLPLDILGHVLLSSESDSEDSRTKSTQLAYELLMKVMLEGEDSYQRALVLFQTLVKTNRIPEPALAHAGGQCGSFLTVVTTALLRACLWYGWRDKAAGLLMAIFRNPQWFRAYGLTGTDVQAIADLTFELLHDLLFSPSEHEVKISQRLIMGFLPITSSDISISYPLPSEIPLDVLFLFYDSCHYHKLAAPAAQVYYHLQSPQLRRHHYYPPPRHEALLWLLDHFSSPGISWAEKSRRDLEGHVYMARSMLSDVLNRNHPVLPVHRPRLISIAAARGFELYARKFWELYTAKGDPDRDIVRGNAHMLVQLVKMFVKAQERWNVNEKNKAVNYCEANESSSGIAYGGAKHAASNHLRDYRRFAEKVLTSYVETKVPLATASQHDLNALARAQLILGHFPEAMETLGGIMQREDTPQIVAINVALTGLARYSPTRAEEMIKHMLGRGVLPRASTFSAVLHEALRDKDVELGKRLISQASVLGYGALTAKGIASLVRSTMTFNYTSDMRERLLQQQNVRWTMNAIEKIMRNRSKKSIPNDHTKDYALSVGVGVQCVRGSLKALQPHMAFRFWWLLLKDRVLWDDRGHLQLRAWIARSIRLEWRENGLATTRAARLLEVLGAPGVQADGPQRTEVSKRWKNKVARG